MSARSANIGLTDKLPVVVTLRMLDLYVRVGTRYFHFVITFLHMSGKVREQELTVQ